MPIFRDDHILVRGISENINIYAFYLNVNLTNYGRVLCR